MSNKRTPRPRSLQRTLGSMVLGFESFIIFFATLVAFGLDKEHGAQIWAVGLTLTFLLILTPAFLGSRWSYYFGWVLQAAMLATAFWVPLMWVVGIIFLGIWTWGMIAGATIDKAKNMLAENGISINLADKGVDSND
jgi:hypothetical protein